MRDGYLRGSLTPPAAQRQMAVLAAFVVAGGPVQDAAELVGIRPSIVKRHLADLRARSGLTTEQLIYAGRAEGWLGVPGLESVGLHVTWPSRDPARLSSPRTLWAHVRPVGGEIATTGGR